MFNTVGRLGKDADLRFTAKGDPVLSFSVGYDCGYGDKKRTNWAECALWGRQAEALAPYMKKGQQVYVVLTDYGMEAYPKKDGTQGYKLTGKVVEIQLVGSKQERSDSNAVADLTEDVPF